MSLGDLTTFYMLTRLFGNNLTVVLMSFTDLKKVRGTGSRVLGLLDRVPQVPYRTRAHPLPDLRKAEIRFKEVVFSYPSRPAAKVLRGVSLVLRPGTVTAVVGRSGSGKSTLAALLLRSAIY